MFFCNKRGMNASRFNVQAFFHQYHVSIVFFLIDFAYIFRLCIKSKYDITIILDERLEFSILFSRLVHR